MEKNNLANEQINISRLYKNNFKLSEIGMAIINDNGEFIKANPSFCNIVGYEEKELRNFNINDKDLV